VRALVPAARRAGVPVHGVCLGHEALLAHLAGDDPAALDGGFSDDDRVARLAWTPAALASRLARAVPPLFLARASASPLMYFHHGWGWPAGRAAPEGVRVLATAADARGRAFVAAWETTDDARGCPGGAGSSGRPRGGGGGGDGGDDGGPCLAPLSGAQFHAEKAAFEWGLPSAAPHGSGDALVLGSMLSFAFVDAARASPVSNADAEGADGRSGGAEDRLIHRVAPAAWTGGATWRGGRAGPSPGAAVDPAPFPFDQVHVVAPYGSSTTVEDGGA